MASSDDDDSDEIPPNQIIKLMIFTDLQRIVSGAGAQLDQARAMFEAVSGFKLDQIETLGSARFGPLMSASSGVIDKVIVELEKKIKDYYEHAADKIFKPEVPNGK